MSMQIGELRLSLGFVKILLKVLLYSVVGKKSKSVENTIFAGNNYV